MPVEQEACASTTVAESRGKSMEKVLEAANLVKLGNAAELTRCLASLSEASDLNHRDPEGRTFLHFAAAYSEGCLDVLLETPGIEVDAADTKGLIPLHYATMDGGMPMCAYNLAKAMPETCVRKDAAGRTPTDAAAECNKGEVLNAMLLACASIPTKEAVASMTKLLEAGAVPDTWAPNGSSALMLAASVDCTEGLSLLIKHGATIELQDALGRTALMFAAGSSADTAVRVLLDAGASLAARDRRNKGIMDYAGDDSPVRTLLEERMTVLEAAAEKLQAALLASLEDEKPTGAQLQHKESKRKKDKKGRRAKKALAEAEPARPVDSYAQPLSSGDEAAVNTMASQRDTAEQQNCAAPILNGTQSAQDSDTASADTGAEQIHSSSGEGERTSEIALGLAGETTSEDEWKIVGKASRKAAPRMAFAAQPPAAPGMQQQHRHSQQGGQKACKRCPSLASLTESSGTAESLESDHSVLSAATAHNAATQQHKLPVSAVKHRGMNGTSGSPAAHSPPACRSDSRADMHGQPAAQSSALGQTWAKRVAASASMPHQETTASAEPARNADLYSRSSQLPGVLHEQQEACHMYHTCNSSRAIGASSPWDAIQDEQAGISTIPEEAVSSLTDCAPQIKACNNLYKRGTGQSCCAAVRAHVEASTAEAVAAKHEASTLRAELQLLRAAMQQTKSVHQQEIAQLLQSAACHQAQLVREAVQAEKSAMAARLLQTFQGLKGLMHTRPHDDRSSEASKDIMASLLGPQAAVEAAGLPLASAVSQSQDSGAPIHSYAAFEGDAGPQVYHDDAAAATLGASLSSLVSGLSISAPFLCEASATTGHSNGAAASANNAPRVTESFSFFST